MVDCRGITVYPSALPRFFTGTKNVKASNEI